VLTVAAGDLIAPASDEGVTLTVNPFDSTGTPITSGFDMGPELTLLIDTTLLASMRIDNVTVYNNDGTPATLTSISTGGCPAYQITTPGGGYALIHTTVVDNNGHLGTYYVQTQYGDGLYAPAVPGDRDYAQPVSSFTPRSVSQAYGVDAGYSAPDTTPASSLTAWSYVGGGDTIQVQITESCCYDFQLWAQKRTTDGQTFSCPLTGPAFQTVNITVS
jgi:hypothetical protein